MMELEDENRRQRAALKARSNEAATAQRQLRELASRVSLVGLLDACALRNLLLHIQIRPLRMVSCQADSTAQLCHVAIMRTCCA
jgi:hypothetical protein